MNILKSAKFIEKRGLEVVIVLALVVLALAGLVFYVYAWRAVNAMESSGVIGIGVREKILDEVAKDLSDRAAHLEKLKVSPLLLRNIFR
ncbi:MAG: hypothetical protein HY452_02690 [Parcubacteria group bacterium]|nr:hypothetical protein [Parcubacteria group bacterium]